MAITKEEELYNPVKGYFVHRGFEVKAEVNHCDLVAIHPETTETIIVEMKKTFNLALLLQGIERQRLGAQVYLAIERNRKKSGAVNQRYGDLTELCRRLNIGLMTVTFYKTKPAVVELLCLPEDEPIRYQRARKGKRLVQEFNERSGDYNVGGSHAKKLVTSYREKALRCALSLQQLEISSPKNLSTHCGIANVATLLRHNYYGWFHKVERGKYTLTQDGHAAIVEYKNVITGWTNSSL